MEAFADMFDEIGVGVGLGFGFVWEAAGVAMSEAETGGSPGLFSPSILVYL